MRLAKVAIDGHEMTGLVEGDLVGVLDDLVTLDRIIDEGLPALKAAGALAPIDQVKLADVHVLAPIHRGARCLFATGLNYRAHYAEGVGKRGAHEIDEPEWPTFFTKATTTITGPFDSIEIDESLSDQFDYEGELAVIIGRVGRDIPEDEALSFVMGYTVANDITARDVQRRHGGQWLKGKSIDGTCPLGPWIVTADELAQPQALELECTVNGEVRQHASTAAMRFSVARLIHDLSMGMTLLSGDVLLTGTPDGVGWAKDPPVFLSDGDEIVTRVSGIGFLQNRIVARGSGSAADMVRLGEGRA